MTGYGNASAGLAADIEGLADVLLLDPIEHQKFLDAINDGTFKSLITHTIQEGDPILLQPQSEHLGTVETNGPVIYVEADIPVFGPNGELLYFDRGVAQSLLPNHSAFFYWKFFDLGEDFHVVVNEDREVVSFGTGKSPDGADTQYMTGEEMNKLVSEFLLKTSLGDAKTITSFLKLGEGIYSVSYTDSNGTFRKATFFDSNGDQDGVLSADILIDGEYDPESQSYRRVQVTVNKPDLEPFQYAALGSIVGSTFGRLLVGEGNEFASTVTSSLVGVIGLNLGQYIDFSNGVPMPDAIASASDVFNDFGDELRTSLENAAIGSISSFLVMELGESIGLEGFGAELFNTVGTSTLSQVLSNIHNPAGLHPFAGFKQESLFSGNSGAGSAGFLSSAVGAYLGAKLGSLIVQPQTQAGQVLSSLGSSVGALLLGGSKVAGSYFGSMASSIATSFQFLGRFADLVAPGIGSLIGFVLGAVIGNLFGSKTIKIPTANAETILNLDTGYYQVGQVSSQNGGNEEVVRDMAKSAKDILNSIVGLVTDDSEIAGNANLASPTQVYGQTGDSIWVRLGGADSAKSEFSTADEAVESGALWAIRKTAISGGDIFLKRAILKSQSDSIMSVLGDLEIAKDYSTYYQNREFFDRVLGAQWQSLSASDRSFYSANSGVISRIASADKLALSSADHNFYIQNQSSVDRIQTATEISSSAAGYLLTIIRANELGLDKTSASDFYGGLAGFADSLKILADFEFDFEHVTVALDGTTLNVNYNNGTESGTWAATNFFSGAKYRLASGSLTQYNAVGKSMATSGKQVLGPARFISGIGPATSNSNDLWILAAGSTAAMVDYHTEKWEFEAWINNHTETQSVTRTVNIVGGGDDIFIGNSGSNSIYGGTGFDWLDGGTGNDTIYGGTEDDVLLGRNGADVLYGEAGDDYLAGGSGNDTLRGGADNDQLVDEAGADRLYGDAGNDTLLVSQDNTSGDVFDGGTGTDLLSFDRWGQAVVNHNWFSWSALSAGLRADHGDDYFDGVAVRLGDGSAYGDTFASIEGLVGTDRNDFLMGGSANDELRGGAGGDFLHGGAGNDTLEGGRGADMFVGAAGSDTVSYNSSDYAVWVDWSAGQATAEAFGGDADGDTFNTVENLRGTKFDDTFKGDSGSNAFWGGRGDDWFVATAGSDRFYGEADFDTVDYSEYTSAVQVNLAGGYGTGGAAGHTYSGIEHIVGTDFADTLTGGAEDNVFQGGKGNDTLSGGLGLDTYIFHRGDGHDTINEVHKGGWDTLMFGEGVSWSDLTIGAGAVLSFTLAASGGTDQVTVVNNWTGIPDKGSRQAKIDSIDVGGVGAVDIQHLEGGNSGGDNADTVYGDINNSNHADILLGYAGNDIIRAGGTDNYDNKSNIVIAGRGNDTIYTSVGDDTFVFERGDGVDTIRDTGGVDRIQFGPSVAADDVIFEIIGTDLYVGIRDADQPELKASHVADRIRIIGGASTTSGYKVEYITAGGVDIDLRKIVLENSPNGDWVWDGVGGTISLDTGVSIGDLLGNSVQTLGYDPENNTTNISVRDLPPGLSYNASTGLISGTATTGGAYQVTLSAYDTVSKQTSERVVTLEVNQGNQAPVVVGSNPITAKQASEDAAFSYQFATSVFSDPDGDVLTYSAKLSDGSALPAWLSFNASTRTFGGTPAQGDVGSILINVTATDPSGATATEPFYITVANTNDGPRVSVALSNQSVAEDAAFSFALPSGSFTDPDGDTLTYSATLSNGSALPSWLSFNASTRTFSGTPGQADVGQITVRVTATDPSSSQAYDDFTLTVDNVNDVPVVNIATADKTVSEDSALSFTLPSNAFTDVDGDTLTLSARLSNGAALPGWLSFNASTRTFSGTPSQSEVGTFTVRVTASDGRGGTATDNFDVTVTNVNNAPVAAMAIANRTTSEDSAFSYTFDAGTFTDQDGDVLTLSATLQDGASLPAWLSFDAATRTFSGTPQQADVGNISVRVTATDPSGASASRTFAIGVVSVNDAPVVSVATADQSAGAGQAFSLTLPAGVFTDEEGGALSLSATLSDGSALPSWLSFDAPTRTFSGTPASGDVGSLSVRITATDTGGLSVSDTFDIAVAAGAPTPGLAQIGVGYTEAETLTLAGGYAIDSTRSGVSGGQVIKATGTGTASGEFVGAAGTYDLAIDFENESDGASIYEVFVNGVSKGSWDGAGGSDTLETVTFQIDLAPGDAISFQGTQESGEYARIDRLSIVSAGGAPLNTPTSLDLAALFGSPSDGSLTYDASGYPGGLSVLNGILTGTASQAGSYAVTATATKVTTLTVTGSPGAPATPPAIPSNLTSVVGTSNNDVLVDVAGGQAYDGSSGWDVLQLSGVDTDYTFYQASTGEGIIVHNVTGDIDTITNIDALEFSGMSGYQDLFYYVGLRDGTAASETLVGTAGAELLSGGDGNDLLYGGLGDDYIDGGAGWDRINLIGVKSDYTFESHPDGKLSIINNVTGEHDVVWNIEQFAFMGGPYGDQIADLTVTNVAYAAPDLVITGGGTIAPINLDLASLFGDPSDGSITYTASGYPAGVTLSNGVLTGTPTSAGAYTLTVTAIKATTLDVTAMSGANTAPSLIEGISDVAAYEDTVFGYTFAAETFSDADGDTLTYAATLSDGSALPSWLSFDASTRTFSGTPAQTDVDAFLVKVTASDPSGAVATNEFIVDVRYTNDAPVASGVLSNTTAVEGENFSLSVPTNTFTDADGDTLYLSATLSDGSPLPEWLSLDVATGRLVGTPRDGDSAAGPVSVRIFATDGIIADIERPYVDVTIDVEVPSSLPPADQPWVWESAALPNLELVAGSALTPIDPSSAVTDPDSDVSGFEYTWTGFAAAGLSVDVNGQLIGTPATPGIHTITLTVRDPLTGQTDDRVFELNVEAPASPGFVPTVVIFDDTLESNAALAAGNLSTSELSTDPAGSGSATIRVVGGAWNGGGVRRSETVTEDTRMLRFRIYREPGSDTNSLTVEYGSWLQLNLDASNNAHWSIDGVSGLSGPDDLVEGQWHTVEVDLTGLGITSFKGIFVSGDSDGNDVFHFDDVTLGPVGAAPGPVDQPWVWESAALPNLELVAGSALTPIDPANTVVDPDSDVSGFEYTWSGFAAAGLSVDANGQLTGTPATPGIHTITLTVRDPLTGQTDDRVFELNVEAQADPLQLAAGNDQVATAADVPVTFYLAGNDTYNGNRNNLSISSVAGQAISVGGSVDVGDAVVVLNTDGSVTVTPDSAYSGDVIFAYVLTDGTLSDTASATVHVEAPSSGSVSPTLVAFDDAVQSGAYLSAGGLSSSVLSDAGDPVASGSQSFRVTTGSYNGGGIYKSLSVTPDTQMLRFKVYRETGSDAWKFEITHDSWAQHATLDGSNNAYWSIDGVSGQTDIDDLQIGVWQTVEVDLSGLGITDFQELSIVGGGSGGDVYYLDDVTFGPEGSSAPSTLDHTLYGTSFAETLTGTDGNDSLNGLGGNDRLIGGSGADRVVLGGGLSDYTFTEHSNGVVIARNLVSGEADALIEIEEVWFAGDQTLHDLPDIITSVTIDPVPEFAATPLDGQISEGGFAYPVVIDLGGDGADLVSVTQSRVVFESDSGGPLMRMGWVGPKDGMLVLDRDGDGIINRLSEISFVNDLPGAKSDLEGLRAYDSNDDGVLDASDDAWSLFQVWRDVNQNGIGMGKELATLDEIGITSINLALTVVNESTDGFADSIVLNEAEIILASGATSTIFDVALRGELAHIDGPALAGTPPQWVTYSWTTDGGFGVAHAAAGHSGLEDDLAELQTISGSDLGSSDIPLQDLVRYVDSDDSLASPPEFTFDPNDPLTPTFGIKPIVFDLDGDGLDLIDPGMSPILRDANGDGAEDRMGWVGEGDGFLALDRNGDGSIDPVSEISFVDDVPGALTDLEGLRSYDTNQDGWLDANDAEFDRFLIWKDINYNAFSDAGELSSLAEMGIARIGLTSAAGSGYQNGPLSNTVFGMAQFEWSDGTFGELGDVELRAFEGNALEQAIQQERRAALLAASRFGAASELAARRNAISELSGEKRVNDGATSVMRSETEGGGASSAQLQGSKSPSGERYVQPSSVSRYESGVLDAGFGAIAMEWQGDNRVPGLFGGHMAILQDVPEDTRRRARDTWWLEVPAGRRSERTQGSLGSLLERLSEFDLAREASEPSSSAQIALPQEGGEKLAERQRFLQAIASFRGASGVPLVRRYGETGATIHSEIGAGSTWLRSGQSHRFEA